MDSIQVEQGHGLIYGLKDPRNQEIFYIGMTINQYARYTQHIYGIRSRNVPLRAHVLDIQSDGLQPEFIYIEQHIPDAQLALRERYWIYHYISTGHRLVNQRYNSICSIVYNTEGYMCFDISNDRAQIKKGVMPDSFQWFNWLEGLESFRFEGKSCGFTARSEKKQRGKIGYWYAHCKANSHQYRRYLGTTDKLTLACLEDASDYFQEVINAQCILPPQDVSILKHDPAYNDDLQYIASKITNRRKREKEIAAGQLLLFNEE